MSRVQLESMQVGMPWALPDDGERRRAAKLSAFGEGFSLEAGAHVAAEDSQGLLHLLRYGLRGPLSLKRLRRLEDGRVELQLRRPMYDGTQQVAYTPSQFIRRLAGLVPPPRVHSTRYFGVFAPASKLSRT